MSREHVLLLDRSGYSKYQHPDGRPFLDPEQYEVTLFTLPEKAGDAGSGELERTVPVDVFDEAAIVREATALHARRPLHRVLAVGERLLLPAGRLRDELDLPGLSWEQTRVFRDKAAMKRYFREHGIRTPDFITIDRPADAQALLRRYGRIVLKPLFEMGSAGMYQVDSAEQLDALDREGLPAYGAYEAEEYVDGVLYHVDSVVDAGRPVVAVASEYLDPTRSYAVGRPCRSVAVDPGPARDAVLRFNDEVLRSVPWFSGVTHLEVFRTGAGEAVLCEIAARPGGAGIIPALRHRYGVDLTECVLLGQVDRPFPELVERQPAGRRSTGWLSVYPPHPGELRSVSLPQPAPWVIQLKQNRKPGDQLGVPTSFGQYIALVTLFGPDQPAVTARLDEMCRSIRVEMAPKEGDPGRHSAVSVASSRSSP